MKKLFAFTLAEMIIVIGIIGVIAEFTIPTLINDSKKQVTSVKLLKYYSMMQQAIRMSESQNGTIEYWDPPSDKTLSWFNTYLAPYISYNKIETEDKLVRVFLNDGTKFEIDPVADGFIDFYYFLDPQTKEIFARNVFQFMLVYNENADPGLPKNGFGPFAVGKANKNRTDWQTGQYACTKENTDIKRFCTGLIMQDGWKIAKDYPW